MSRIALVMLAACSEPREPLAPGRMSVEFTWAGGILPAESRGPLWIHASVEERRESVDAPGKVLVAQAAQLAMDGTIAMTLEGVPNGDGRVVVATVRSGPDPSASTTVYYLGYSERFSLAAGVDEILAVRVQLSPVPEPGILSVGRWAGADAPHVVLEFPCDTCDGRFLYVARDAALSRGLAVLPASAHGGMRSGRSNARYSIPYDLSVGCTLMTCQAEAVYVMARDSRGRNVEFLSAPVPPPNSFNSRRASWLVPLAGDLRDLRIDDAKNVVYVLNASPPQIEIYSLNLSEVQGPIALGPNPIAFDLSPDESSIAVAHSSTDALSLIDFASGSVTRFVAPRPPGPFDGPIRSIAIAGDDENGYAAFLARASTSTGCSPIELSAVHLQELELIRGIRGVGSLVSGERWSMMAAADGVSLAIGIPNGVDCPAPPVFSVDASSPRENAISASSMMPEVDPRTLAIDGAATTVLVNGSFVFNGDLTLRGVISDGGEEAGLSSSGLVGFRMNGGRVDVLDMVGLSVEATLDLPDTVTGGGARAVGRLAVSRDGWLVAVITDRGISLVNIPGDPGFEEPNDAGADPPDAG